MNSNWSYSPETPNLGQNRRFFEPCDLAIWQMTLKNIRAPLLCYFKLCKMCISLYSLVKSNWSYSPETPNKHQVLCIISSPYVNSKWSYGPETAKWGHDLCYLDLWPWHFAWTSLLSLVKIFVMIRWREQSQQGKSEGFDSCNWPSDLVWPMWPWN